MAFITYVPKRFKTEVQVVIDRCNEVIEAYQAKGYDLTLRQLYYQMIAKDLFPASWIDEEYNLKSGLPLDTKNTVKSYKRLGDIVSDARRAGLIDWDAIVDRTRNLEEIGTWSSPQSIIAACGEQFKFDWWKDQINHVEAWFEKDALEGIFERVAQELRLPYFSCRGYPSDSAVWAAAQRLRRIEDRGQHVVLLHLGDHDPSGKDMTRDIAERMELFRGPRSLDLRRLALNMDQVLKYDPPPNPAKVTDPRAGKYMDEFGDESWELDALEPEVLTALVRDEVTPLIEKTRWAAMQEKEEQARYELQRISEEYDNIVANFS